MNPIPILMDEDVRREYIELAKFFGLAMRQLYDSLRPIDHIVHYVDISAIFRDLLDNNIPIGRYSIDADAFSKVTNHLGEEFNRTLCISVNECVAHGKNRDKVCPGDLVTIDAGISVSLNSLPFGRKLYFDAAFTYLAGGETLPDVAIAPLFALKQISDLKGEVGVRDIATIIQRNAWDHNFSVVTELAGHGIGYSLHEYPGIPNAVFAGTTIELPPHIFINPEPMYVSPENRERTQANKVAKVRLHDDGWSVIATGISAHWETTFYYDGFSLYDIIGITKFPID